jgi:hypothetical protein
MPSPISVQIGPREFRSMNQARLHYREVLHRSEPSRPVVEADRVEVMELVKAAALGAPCPADSQVHVVKVSYGRRGFEVRGNEGTTCRVSIMRAVRECAVVPPVSSPTRGDPGDPTTTPPETSCRGPLSSA